MALGCHPFTTLPAFFGFARTGGAVGNLENRLASLQTLNGSQQRDSGAQPVASLVWMGDDESSPTEAWGKPDPGTIFYLLDAIRLEVRHVSRDYPRVRCRRGGGRHAGRRVLRVPGRVCPDRCCIAVAGGASSVSTRRHVDISTCPPVDMLVGIHAVNPLYCLEFVMQLARLPDPLR